MIFLLANIAFASLFGLCVKWIENRNREDVVTIGMINYIVAAILISPEWWNSAPPASTPLALAIGATLGLSYFVAFFFCVYAIRWIGVSNSTVISILSICVPILAGMWIWHEVPHPWQWGGIGLALVSLGLIGRSGGAIGYGQVPEKPWFAPWVMIGFFALCGLNRLTQEAFRHVCDDSERPAFLAAAFASASAGSIAVLIVRRRKITNNEWWIGAALGAANLLQTHFILLSLKLFPGYFVFPIVSAGGLILTTALATQWMGERLGRRSFVGITIACVALILLNWNSK